MTLRSLEGAFLDVLREQRQNAVDDLELFDGIVRALEAMSPEGRMMAMSRLAKAFPRLPEQPDGDSPANQQSPPVRSLTDLDIRAMTYADAAFALLDRTTKMEPLSTRILMNRMRLHGKKITGNDPYRILYRSLKNDPEGRFVSIRGRWALADWFPKEPPVKVAGEREADNEAREKGLLDAVDED